MRVLPNKTVKKVYAYKGTPFTITNQTGRNDAGTSYTYVHNRNLELVAISLIVTDPVGSTFPLFSKYIFRDGGTSSQYTTRGYYVQGATKDSVSFFFWAFNESYSTSTLLPVFYFKSN